MRAILLRKWGNADQLTLAEIPIPSPKPNQLLVKIHCAALNPVDYKIRNGRFKWFIRKPFPLVLGLEASGTLVEAPQKRVYVYTSRSFQMGCYAEYAAVDQDRIFELPEGIDFQAGAALAVAPVTALQALRDHGQVRAGSTVLINGASGSVGQCALQIALKMGANVTGVSRKTNHERLLKLGAHRVIDYQTTDFTLEEHRYDLILDCVSSRRFSECQKVLQPNGRYVNLMLRPLDLLYQKLHNLFSRQKFITFVMDYQPADLEWICQQLKNGNLQLPVEHLFPLEKIKEAHQKLESGRSTGKILLQLP